MPESEEEKVIDQTDDEILSEEVSEEEEGEVGKEDKEEEGEDKEEEEKKEEEGEEDIEEEKEVKIPFDRPTLTDIKAKYPDFFKDFPSLRDAFFREQRFTQIFPTIEDAEEAFGDVEAFRSLQDSVLAGDPKPLLDSIESADTGALSKFVTAFLPNLYKRDTALYTEVVTPLLENAVRAVYRQGVSSGDEDLQNSALHFSKFLFDSEDVATGKKTTVQTPRGESAESKKLEEKKKEFEAEKYTEFFKSITDELKDSLHSLVVKDFDPDSALTPFLKRKCVEEVIDQVGRALEADKSHMAVMNARWVRARRDGYSGDSKAKIVTAYLARAKSLVPSIREKVRREALGTTKVSQKQGKTIKEQALEKKVPIGEAPRKSGSVSDPKKIDWRKSSDMDILSGRATLRS